MTSGGWISGRPSCDYAMATVSVGQALTESVVARLQPGWPGSVQTRKEARFHHESEQEPVVAPRVPLHWLASPSQIRFNKHQSISNSEEENKMHHLLT